MKTIIALVALTGMTSGASAGCLTGAVAGGVAGHVAGRHSTLGAIGGCAVGHHMAVMKKRQLKAKQQAAAAQSR